MILRSPWRFTFYDPRFADSPTSPLIKSPVEGLSQDTQQEESSAKGEDSWGKLQDVHVRQRAKIIPYGVPDRIKNDAT